MSTPWYPVLTAAAAIQAAAEGDEVLIGEPASFSSWRAALRCSPTGSAEVARDAIEASTKGLFKLAQFRAESDADELS
jgi:hypothetical protein